jgi:hypothetical protein
LRGIGSFEAETTSSGRAKLERLWLALGSPSQLCVGGIIMIIILYDLAVIQGEAVGPEMTTGGWVFMISAWACIFTLIIFCFSKVLANKKKK